MTQGQGNSVPLYCPLCGGLMSKPAGSTLHWHAAFSHPHCHITTISETLLAVHLTEASPHPEPSKPRGFCQN